MGVVDVDPPVVFELMVGVEVKAVLQVGAVEVPRAPAVEVVEIAAEDGPVFFLAQLDPEPGVVEVAAPLEAKVVDLEMPRIGLPPKLAAQPTAVLAQNRHIAQTAAALVIYRGAAAGELAPKGVAVVAPLEGPIHAASIGVSRAVALHSRAQEADVRVAGKKILLDATDEEVSARLNEEIAAVLVLLAGYLAHHGRLNARVLFGSKRRQQAKGGLRRGLARQLGRAQNGGGLALVEGIVAVGQRVIAGLAADAPRVEQVNWSVEGLAILHEEGTTLFLERLKDREVEFARVGFHLAEIRVERGVERDARRQPVAQVRAGIAE